MVIPSYTGATAFDNENNELKKWQGGGNHYQNFLQAVQSQDASLLNAPIEEGHLSSALCHTGGVSHQLGVALPVQDIQSQFSHESKMFEDSVNRMLQHLKANEAVDNGAAEVVWGNELLMDPKAETIIENSRAADMMSREYRDGFEISEI